jgi:hypothetical protein
MNKNLDLVAKELYNKISSYPNLVMKDSEGNDVESDQSEGARKFNFEYEVDGKNLATVTISLNDDSENQDSFEVLISNDPADGSDEYAKKMFLKFGREMREFAKQHMLTFNIHVATRSNKERDTGDSIMSESKLFGTAKTSYQRIGEATLIIKHRDVVNQENPAGRAQRIESIYVENAEGERFKYPYKHLNGARAMAQHVAHGGNPYDGIGQYMVGLSEEMNRLRMFKHYVERNEMVSEAMGAINSKVMERIEQVKREIQQLQRPSHYAEFAESFTESESVEIPEDVMNDWIDRLTVRTFNEELKNVFPYIFKLVSEDDIPVKELSVEDLVNEDGPDDLDEEPDSIIIPELAEYEQYLARLTEAEQEGIFAAENEDAIAELNELLSNPMPLGVDGTNVMQSLEGLGFDKDFLNGLKKMAGDETGEGMDARPFIKEYVQQKDAELGTDVLGQLVFGDDNEIAADQPEPVEPEPATDVMPPAEEPPAEEPPAEDPNAVAPEELPMPPAPPQAPVAEAMIRERNTQMFNELKEFIMSMYNEDAGNFPKGVEGVKIACEKKFGDRVGPIAAKIVERMTSMGEMKRIRELSGLGNQNVVEKFDARQRTRLNDLIDLYRDSTDPDPYNDYADDPDDVILRIRREFGDKIADQVEAGARKMHFPRDNHVMGRRDPLSWKQPVDTDRITKKGKMYKQDSDYRKNMIKSRYKFSGRSATEGVVDEDNDPWWMDRAHPYLAKREKEKSLAQKKKDEKQDNKPKKQGVEETSLSELSKGTLEKYKSKAKAQAKNARYYGNYGDPDDPQDVKDEYHKFADKREAGAKKADARLKKEVVLNPARVINSKGGTVANPNPTGSSAKTYRYVDLKVDKEQQKTHHQGVTKEDSELTAMLRIAGLR